MLSKSSLLKASATTQCTVANKCVRRFETHVDYNKTSTTLRVELPREYFPEKEHRLVPVILVTLTETWMLSDDPTGTKPAHSTAHCPTHWKQLAVESSNSSFASMMRVERTLHLASNR